MPVQHLVLFKVKEGVSPDALRSMEQAILGLKEKLPELVLSATFGASIGQLSKGFTHAACMVLPSREALAQYLPHDAHQQAVRIHIDPIVDEVILLDFDF